MDFPSCTALTTQADGTESHQQIAHHLSDSLKCLVRTALSIRVILLNHLVLPPRFSFTSATEFPVEVSLQALQSFEYNCHLSSVFRDLSDD